MSQSAATVRKPDCLIELPLSSRQADKLRIAAARYGKSPRELAGAVLAIVIADDLFKAVIG